MIEKAPAGWQLELLGNLVMKMSNGANVKQHDESVGYPISRIETIWNGNIDSQRVKYIKENDSDFVNKYKLKEGDILFSHINSDSHIGKTAIYRGQPEVLIHGINLLLIRFSDEYCQDFFNYQFKYLKEKGAFSAVAQRAVNQSSINQHKLKSFPFIYPNLEEQKRIVVKIEELFSELDSGIASLKTAQEQLKIYRQALLKHAFEGKLTEQWRKDNADKLETPEQLLARIQTERETRYQQQLEEWKQAVKDWEEKGKEGKKPTKPALPKSSDLHANDAYQRIGGLPASWAWLKLSDLLQNSPQNGLYKPSSFYGLGCQIIRIDNFYDGKVTDKQSLKRLAVTDNEKDTYGLKLGDLIVNRVNSIEYLGKSALIRKLDEPIVFESNIMRCTLLSKTIEREFIVLYLNTIIGRKELCKNAKHAVNQASINQTDVGNSFLPICSLAEQQEIVNLLEEKLPIIEQNEKEIEDALTKAELLRQSILKKAFSGQLS